ncbi:MAG: hypothetical protein WC887_01380 [Candidatus Paceibacterota bacterium]|jgi:ribulose-phosphate 3-epimerase
MGLVVPAVLPTSKKDLEEKLELFSRIPSVSRVQIDVVDGRFVSPASWPYTALEEFRAMLAAGEMLPDLNRFVYEIDLMCLDIDDSIESWLALGVSRITLHAESVNNLPQLLASARRKYDAGGLVSLISFGLALNIMSDIDLIEPCLSEIDYVQFMGIAHIGQQGQSFDERVYKKIRIFHARHPDVPIQVDGGVSLEQAKKLEALGVSNLIVGSAIVRASNPAAAAAVFEELQSPFGV